jgi:ABC-type cobalt transport system substrate-binding protein
MKLDQNILFLIMLLVALWLLFFQKPKTEKFCGACGAAA